MESAYTLLVKKMKELADIGNAIAVLHWDQETYMPKGAALARSQQIGTLSALHHNQFTSEETLSLIKKALKQKNLDKKEHNNVRLIMLEYDKSKKFDEAFVRKRSMTISKAFQNWATAKSENNFSIFESSLNEIIAIKQEEAAVLNVGKHPYDSLLDTYEPGLTVEKLDTVFSNLKKDLLPIIKQITEKKKVDYDFLNVKVKKDRQWKFGLKLLKQMGYDFDTGRQDISTHPFTISFSPTDVRVTTRIDENDFSNMIWSCIHEGGHALYEQGLDPNENGLPSGSAISLAIHESQSRLWENQVGRSKAYWKYNLPKLQKAFKNLKDVELNEFYKAINQVKPNYIRTEADELHYHIHIIIRYEIEKAMLENKVDAAGARELWNKKYKEYLGLDITDDSKGILQDIHWSHGSIGYFPTYTLGSLYAAQFYQQAEKEIESLEGKISKGNLKYLFDWLREHIHVKGRSIEAEELCTELTGEGLNALYFIDYVKEKYKIIYNIK